MCSRRRNRRAEHEKAQAALVKAAPVDLETDLRFAQMQLEQAQRDADQQMLQFMASQAALKEELERETQLHHSRLSDRLKERRRHRAKAKATKTAAPTQSPTTLVEQIKQLMEQAGGMPDDAVKAAALMTRLEELTRPPPPPPPGGATKKDDGIRLPKPPGL